MVHFGCGKGEREDVMTRSMADIQDQSGSQSTLGNGGSAHALTKTTNSFSHSLRWRPTSLALLAAAERKILRHVWQRIEDRFVVVGNGSKRIRTISLNTDSRATPIVMVHGMGSGVGLWALNIDPISKHRPLHAFDVLGFGRSSRPKFAKDAMQCEMEFVESFEEWRKEMNLDKFILLGHSMGGFLSAAYALRYPQYLQHLILVDPWGFPELPKETDEKKQRAPMWIRAIATMLSPFNPFSGLRAAGPWGPGLISRLRPDLIRKFSSLFDEDDDSVPMYIYHSNAQDPSGETAFKNLTQKIAWARYPMVSRMHEIAEDLPITFLCGAKSWIDSSVAYEVKYIRNKSYVDVQIVKGAGHHIYADQYMLFNDLVNRISKKVDLQDSADQHLQPVEGATDTNITTVKGMNNLEHVDIHREDSPVIHPDLSNKTQMAES